MADHFIVPSRFVLDAIIVDADYIPLCNGGENECDLFAANNNSRTEITIRIDGTKLKRGCFEHFFGDGS